MLLASRALTPTLSRQQERERNPRRRGEIGRRSACDQPAIGPRSARASALQRTGFFDEARVVPARCTEVGRQHALLLQYLRGRGPLLVGDGADAVLLRVRAEERRLDVGVELRQQCRLLTLVLRIGLDDDVHCLSEMAPMPCCFVYALKNVDLMSASSCASSVASLPLYSGLALTTMSTASFGCSTVKANACR